MTRRVKRKGPPAPLCRYGPDGAKCKAIPVRYVEMEVTTVDGMLLVSQGGCCQKCYETLAITAANSILPVSFESWRVH